MATNDVELNLTVDASKAIAGTRKAIKEIEDTIKGMKTSTTSGDSKLIAIGEEFKKAKTEARKFEKETSVLAEEFERKFGKASPAIQKVIDKLVDLHHQINETTDDNKRKELVAAFNTSRGQLSGLETRYNKAHSTTLGLAGKEGTLAKYLSANDELLKKQETLNTLKEQYLTREQEIAQETQKTAEEEKSVNEAATDAAEKTRQQADATKDAADATNKLKQATDDIGKTAKPVEKPREDIGKTVRPGAQNDLKKASDEAKKTAEEFADLQTKVNTALNFDKANTDIASLVKHLLELQQAQKAIEKAGMPTQYHEAYNQIYAEIDRTKRAITAYKQSMNGVAEAHKRVEKSGVRSGSRVAQAFNNLKKAGAGIGKLINSIKSGFRSLSKHTDKVRSSFNGMSKGMNSNFKHLLRNITKYVFGFRSLFFLVRRLRRYLVEGIKNIVQYESAIGQSKRLDSTNQALNRLRTSLLFLQNAWAAAFQPVIMIGAKILSPFIDMLARAGNAVARFLGVLTGQKVVYQAVKTPAKDYAKSLKDSGSGAGKAAKKQKELNDRIAEFDDLILLGRDKDPNNDNGTGGGAGGNDDDYDYSKMFKKAKAVSSLAEMIKKAWQTADFTSVGEYIRDKIVGALEGIKWDEVKTTAFKVGRSLATLLNGVFADPKLWESVGKSFGEAINTLSQAISGFLKNMKVDWGGNLANLINRSLKTIDWETIKNNIRTFAQQLASNIASFFNNMDWEEVKKACHNIGESIRIFIDNTLKNQELMKSIGAGIGEFVNSVGELLAGLLTEPENGGLLSELDDNKANSIGDGLGTFLISALKKINWPQVAKNFEGLLSGVFTGISDFFDSEEGQKVLDDIVNAFSMVDWAGLATKGVNAVLTVGEGVTMVASTLLNAISDGIINADPEKVEGAVTTFFDEVDWEKLGNALAKSIETIVKSLEASGALVTIAGSIAKGIWEGFKGAITGDGESKLDWGQLGIWIIEGLLAGAAGVITRIGAWVVEKIFGPFRDAITGKEAFDMGSPSKVAEQWGSWIMEGLLNGVVSLVDNVKTEFTNLKNNIEGKFTTAKDNVIATVNTLKSNVGLAWDDMLLSATTKLTAVKNKIIEIWEKVQEGIKTPINGIIGVVESLINKMVGGINSITKKLNGLPSLKFKNPFSGQDYTLGFKIPELSTVKIPRLAQGAVIPPNREFMAMLGDQSHGTNIEAPLDTIKQAVAEVMANNGNAEVIQLLQELITVVEHKNLTIGDKEIGKATVRYNNQQRIIRGTSY